MKKFLEICLWLILVVMLATLFHPSAITVVAFAVFIASVILLDSKA